jgi:hypothetical protein
MRKEDIEELSSFFSELQRETDRGLPLVSAALLDEKLLEALRSFFCVGKATDRLLLEPNAPLGTFSARIDACFALGLIDEHEYQEISLVRKIRNLFAHSRHGLSFSDEKVTSLCTSLVSPLPPDRSGNASARYRFINATVSLIVRLYYRDKWVERERRSARTWVNPEETRWRSFKTDQPPEGAQYIALGPSGAWVVDGKADFDH